jgi:NADH:ubiquinone oxidoreductase subunit 6 (subunit J)
VEAINWHSFFFLLFALLTSIFAIAVVVAGNIVRMAFYLIVSLGATAGLFFLAGADFVGAMQLMIYVGGTLVLLIFGVMLTAQGPFISMKTSSGEWILGVIVGGALLAVLLQTAFSVEDWQANSRLAHPLAVLPAAGSTEPAVVIRSRRPGVELARVTVQFDEQAESRAAYDAGAKTLTFRADTSPMSAAAVMEALADDEQASELFEAALAAGATEETAVETRYSSTTAFVSPSTPYTATRLGLGLLGQRVDKLEQPNDRLRDGMSGYLLPFEVVSMHLLVVLVGAAYLARTKKRARASAAP